MEGAEITPLRSSLGGRETLKKKKILLWILQGGPSTGHVPIPLALLSHGHFCDLRFCRTGTAQLMFLEARKPVGQSPELTPAGHMACDCHTTATPQAHRHTTATSLPHHRHTTATIPQAYYSHAAGTPLPHRRHTAGWVGPCWPRKGSPVSTVRLWLSAHSSPASAQRPECWELHTCLPQGVPACRVSTLPWSLCTFHEPCEGASRTHGAACHTAQVHPAPVGQGQGGALRRA